MPERAAATLWLAVWGAVIALAALHAPGSTQSALPRVDVTTAPQTVPPIIIDPAYQPPELPPPPEPEPPILEPPPVSRNTAPEAPPPPPPPPVDPNSHLDSIRQCESGGNYAAVSPGGQYRGAYQFSQSTWEAMGGTGDPAAASPAEQDARAQALYDQAGPGQWPVCQYR